MGLPPVAGATEQLAGSDHKAASKAGLGGGQCHSFAALDPLCFCYSARRSNRQSARSLEIRVK